MIESNFLKNAKACLHLTASFVFCYGGLDQMDSLPAEPFIEWDRNTTLALVWLILTGALDENDNDTIVQTEGRGYAAVAQGDIGVKVLESPQRQTIGTWLNPQAKIFVCFRGCHFFVVELRGQDLLVHDCLSTRAVVQSAKALKWH